MNVILQNKGVAGSSLARTIFAARSGMEEFKIICRNRSSCAVRGLACEPQNIEPQDLSEQR